MNSFNYLSSSNIKNWEKGEIWEMYQSANTVCPRLQFYTMPSEQHYPFANDKMLQEHLYKMN